METQKDSLDVQNRTLPLSGEQSFLLAEGSANEDVQRAFTTAGMSDTLYVVSDGEKAIDYLSGNGSYGNRLTHPMPKIVLLDSNLPRKNGFEVLDWMRSQSNFKSLITVIFTGLNREVDANRAHAMGADFYLTKPNTSDELVKMIHCLYGWVIGDRGSVRNSRPVLGVAS